MPHSKDIELNPEQEQALKKLDMGDTYVKGDEHFIPSPFESEVILGNIGHDSAHNEEG